MSLAALLAALSLQAAAQPPAADAPTATSPAAPDAAAADTPSGAPADDYGFVSWCKGALSGHLELYPQVNQELGRVEAERDRREDAKLAPAARKSAASRHAAEAAKTAEDDREQNAAGHDYLALYDRGIAAAEKAGSPALHARGEEAQAQGYRIWSAARAADDRTKMWSWLMWELPARCETAARKLETQSGLLGEAFDKTAAASPRPAPEAPGQAAPAEAAPAEAAPATADSPVLRGPQ